VTGRLLSADQAVRVNRAELGRLLRVFRARRDDSVAETETRLRDLLNQKPASEHSRSRLTGLGIAALEGPHGSRTAQLDLLVSDLEVLAAAYAIPRLMLDPLLAEQTDASCLAVREPTLLTVAIPRGATYQGARTRYRVPAAKLAHTEETAFVHLHVEPGGYSDSHAHPGDEMLVVLAGQIEAQLEDSGLCAPLSAGDYVHFYAEQKHSVHNRGEQPADVFVVRYYQLESHGARG
jgi:quercetin dioxygenase-like cupin family protein